MAYTHRLLHLLFIFSIFHLSLGARRLTELVQDSSNLLQYHNGPLLTGKISVNFIWYGAFKPSQKAIVSDFISSLSTKSPLASQGESYDAVNVVLTASDVAVDGFCSSRCGSHGSVSSSKLKHVKGKNYKFAYIWVGNSETQCPGQCAWPFHQPIYGPQAAPLIAPNNDVGMDGVVINLGALLAGTATNPFGNGYYQGDVDAPLEAASACPGVYAKGAYPGYAGDLLVDSTTGASYNAHGTNGRKYLLPALYDPSTSKCSTLV
ncbi:putative protein EXORDIUM [Helianthus annuus]|nr:putative protein EXORDIUM [Helianthus annuus]